MRRIHSIDPNLQVTRINPDRSEEGLGRHAFIQAGDKIRARSDEISYGNIGYDVEFISGQQRVGSPWRIVLDIHLGCSRERTDVFTEDAYTVVAKRDRTEYERYKKQLDIERRKGIIAHWKGARISCLLGSRGESRQYEEGGFNRMLDALLVANLRQFYIGGVEKTPQPNDGLLVYNDGYRVEEVRKEISVLTIALTRDKSVEVNK